MATLALGLVGAGIGWATAATASAAVIWSSVWAGFSIGATIGSFLELQNLPSQDIGKLDDKSAEASQYGVTIPLTYGKYEFQGNCWWSSSLREKKKTSGGGKKGGPKTTRYTYSVDCLYGVCMRGTYTPVIKEIWANDVLLWEEGGTVNNKVVGEIRIAYGEDDQEPDQLMIDAETYAPAYIGYVTVMFEGLKLDKFGNKRPQKMRFVTDTGTLTLEQVWTDLCIRVGYDESELDFSELDQQVIGFAIKSRGPLNDYMQQMAIAYNSDLREAGGITSGLQRGSDPVKTINGGDLAATTDEAGGEVLGRAVEYNRKQTKDLPWHVDLSFTDSESSYEVITVGYSRPSVTPFTDHQQSLNFDFVMTKDFARQLAAKILYGSWDERSGYAFSLPFSYLDLMPGDVVLLPFNGVYKRVRITEMAIGLFAQIEFKAVLDRQGAFTQVLVGGETTPTVPGEDASETFPSSFYAWSGKELLPEHGQFPGFYLVANGPTGWNGGDVYYSADAGLTYVQKGSIEIEGRFGVTAGTLADGTVAEAWDHTNTVPVVMTNLDDLESLPETDVEEGSNNFLIGLEQVGVATATKTSALHYTFEDLLRGLNSTPMTGHTGTDKVVMLDDSVMRVTVSRDLIGETVLVKVVSPGIDIDDVTPVSVVIADPSLPYVTPDELQDVVDDLEDHRTAAIIDHPDGSVTVAKIADEGQDDGQILGWGPSGAEWINAPSGGGGGGTFFAATQLKQVANTAAETTLFGTGEGSLTIPANTLDDGQIIRISLRGIIKANASGAGRLRIKLNSTTLVTLDPVLANDTDHAFWGEMNLVVLTAGASGTVRTAGEFGNELGAIHINGTNNSSSTIDTTIDQVLNVTWEWVGGASVANDIRVYAGFAEFLQVTGVTAGTGSARGSLSVTSSSLAQFAADATQVLALGKTYILHSLATDKAARVRIYSSSATRTADLSRQILEPIISGKGLVAEIITSPGDLTVKFDPPPIGHNMETTPIADAYLTIENLDPNTGTVAVTAVRSRIE